MLSRCTTMTLGASFKSWCVFFILCVKSKPIEFYNCENGSIRWPDPWNMGLAFLIVYSALEIIFFFFLRMLSAISNFWWRPSWISGQPSWKRIWWTHFNNENGSIRWLDLRNMGLALGIAYLALEIRMWWAIFHLRWRPSWIPRWLPYDNIENGFIGFSDPENMGLDPKMVLVFFLVAEI